MGLLVCYWILLRCAINERKTRCLIIKHRNYSFEVISIYKNEFHRNRWTYFVLCQNGEIRLLNNSEKLSIEKMFIRLMSYLIHFNVRLVNSEIKSSNFFTTYRFSTLFCPLHHNTDTWILRLQMLVKDHVLKDLNSQKLSWQLNSHQVPRTPKHATRHKTNGAIRLGNTLQSWLVATTVDWRMLAIVYNHTVER